jgi:hypothetical protein
MVLGRSSHDPLYGTRAPLTVVARVAHLVGREGRRIVTSAEEPSARFVKAEADVAEVLARVTPQEAAPSTPKVTIPKLPPPTQPDRSSFVHFDPRPAR